MDRLSKNIRKNLVDFKKQKKQSIVESKIISNRFKKILSESSNRADFFYKSVAEIKSLQSAGFDFDFLKENIMDLLGVLFDGDSGSTLIDTFKTEGAEHIIKKLNLEKGKMLEQAITKVFSEQDVDDSIKLFSDCDFLCEKIAECLVDEMGVTNQSDSNSMMKSIKMELKISICPILNGLDTKMNSGFSDIKSRILSV